MRKQIINIALALFVLNVILLVFASRSFAGLLSTLVPVVIFGGVIVLSMFKLTLWYRYRNDPEARGSCFLKSNLSEENQTLSDGPETLYRCTTTF